MDIPLLDLDVKDTPYESRWRTRPSFSSVAFTDSNERDVQFFSSLLAMLWVAAADCRIEPIDCEFVAATLDYLAIMKF
jgi:hypothetical protein